MWNTDLSKSYMNCKWGTEEDFPLRDRFAMQYMDRWLEDFRRTVQCITKQEKYFKNVACMELEGIVRVMKEMWKDAYIYADLAMQAREPKKETDDE